VFIVYSLNTTIRQ